MSFVSGILELFNTKMATPKIFGLFHMASIIVTAMFIVLLCQNRKVCNEKFVRRLLIASSVIVIIFEIYKQIICTFGFDGSKIVADYQWSIFPFQFCSTPMYIGVIAVLTKKEKIQDALCSYLATYAVFAGLSVLVYPAQVFVSKVGINIQSMVCHSSMIIVGIYLLASGYVKAEHKTILKALPVFLFLVAVAIIMNEVAYYSGLLEYDTFNMFFINSHCESTLFIYSTIQKFLPYVVCVLIYITVFTLAAYLVLLTAMLIKKLSNKR